MTVVAENITVEMVGMIGGVIIGRMIVVAENMVDVATLASPDMVRTSARSPLDG